MAEALGFLVEKEPGGYCLKDATGKFVLEAAKLGKARAFLISHIKVMAKANHRLTS